MGPDDDPAAGSAHPGRYARAVSRAYVTVVSGAPRSGTSLLMQMLEAGGIPPLCDAARAADAGNPRGYYELEAVKRLPADAGWLERAPGHAVKVVHARVAALPAGAVRVPGGASYRVLFMERDLLEVARSQRTLLERLGHPPADALSDERVAEIEGHQLRAAAAALDARADVARLAVSHARLFQEGEAEVARIDAFLDGGLDRAAMLGRIDPALHRIRRPGLARGAAARQ